MHWASSLSSILLRSVSLSLPPMISPIAVRCQQVGAFVGARVVRVLLHVEGLALLGEVGDETWAMTRPR